MRIGGSIINHMGSSEKICTASFTSPVQLVDLTREFRPPFWVHERASFGEQPRVASMMFSIPLTLGDVAVGI